MAEPAGEPELTAEELARVQTAIDAGTIWATVDGGRFAMRLIDARRCKLAPGVINMWRSEDDLYEPIYSRELLNARVAEALRDLPDAKEIAATEGELRFLLEHGKELVRLRTQEILNEPLLPWRQRKYRLAYLGKRNALRASAGLPPLDHEEALDAEAASGTKAVWKLLRPVLKLALWGGAGALVLWIAEAAYDALSVKALIAIAVVLIGIVVVLLAVLLRRSR
jgi:hypothetical protein